MLCCAVLCCAVLCCGAIAAVVFLSQTARVLDGSLIPWLEREFIGNFSSVPLKKRYITALYWSFTTLTTVGMWNQTPDTISLP